MTTEDFINQLEEIDKGKVGNEIFWWLKENITNYVDTQHKIYYLSFLSDEEKMPETTKIEKLCNTMSPIETTESELGTLTEAIENNADIVEDSKKQEAVNEFLDLVLQNMNENERQKDDLFRALCYYYEVIGFYKSSVVTEKLNGYVSIDYLSFENVRMPVTRTPMKAVKNEAGEIVDYIADTENVVIVADKPPSFAVDFSVNFWEDKGEQSLF